MNRKRESYNSYMRDYMLKHYRKRKKYALKKLGGKCVVCRTTKKLEFDHIDPETKEMIIAKMWSASKIRFETELKKCQLLCKKHHNEKTMKELGKKLAKGNHGTISTYRYCKCSECRKAWAKYHREYKRKRQNLIN